MLEKFYKGDDAWKKFISVFSNHESLKSDKIYVELFEKLNKQEDLSIVIYELIGKENCHKWIYKENPSLAGLKPIDCLSGGLLIRLRTMLMRFQFI